MIISMIAAMDKNRAIGRGNDLPWHIPEDFAHFKAKTSGKAIIMGRKTYESIGRPLPKRLNIVITRDASQIEPRDNVVVVDGLNAAFEKATQWSHENKQDEIMVIGGGNIYTQALPLSHRLYLTHIDIAIEGADAWFPEFDTGEWKVSEDKQSSNDDYIYRFTTYDRLKPKID